MSLPNLQVFSTKTTCCPLRFNYDIQEINDRKKTSTFLKTRSLPREDGLSRNESNESRQSQPFFRGELLVLGSVGLHNCKTKVNLQRVLWPWRFAKMFQRISFKLFTWPQGPLHKDSTGYGCFSWWKFNKWRQGLTLLSYCMDSSGRQMISWQLALGCKIWDLLAIAALEMQYFLPPWRV